MEIKVGANLSRIFFVSEKMANSFVELIGDKNPIHTDDYFANTIKYKNKVAHGMLIVALVTSLIGNDFPGHGSVIVSQTFKFRKPVYMNEEISVNLEIVKIERNGWININSICYNSINQIVFDGIFVVSHPN